MLFVIDEVQWAQISKWRSELPKAPNLTLSARFSYKFIPTADGCNLVVEDGLTGAQLFLGEENVPAEV